MFSHFYDLITEFDCILSDSVIVFEAPRYVSLYAELSHVPDVTAGECVKIASVQRISHST